MVDESKGLMPGLEVSPSFLPPWPIVCSPAWSCASAPALPASVGPGPAGSTASPGAAAPPSVAALAVHS